MCRMAGALRADTGAAGISLGNRLQERMVKQRAGVIPALSAYCRLSLKKMRQVPRK